MEELLKEAYLMFPIGTKFKSPCDDGRVRIVSPYTGEKTCEWYIDGENIRSDNGISCNLTPGCSNPSVYSDGKWADIISESNYPIY